MWYFELNGAQQGPENLEQVQQRLQNGELSMQTLVWRDGMTDWVALSQVPELSPGAITTAQPGQTAPSAAPQHMQGATGAGMMPQQNGMALTSMILGICSVFLTLGCGIGFVLALPAVILGHISRKQIRESLQGTQMQTGDGLALTGLIIGYIVLALSILMICLVGYAVVADGGFAP